MTAPVMAEVSRLRTVEPPEGTDPGPREPVSVRAEIVSRAEVRRRELVGIVRSLTTQLRAALLEEAQLRAHLELAGVVTEEGE